MREGRVDGFFYGLFMDEKVLRELGAEPRDPRRAYVDDHALRIGRRATLVPTSGSRSYGVVMALTHAELDDLYSAPGLEDYRPEEVEARLMGGGSLLALCWVLRDGVEPNETNTAYPERLGAVIGRLDFPAEYVASVTEG